MVLVQNYHLIYKVEERQTEEFKVRRIFIRTITEADIIGDQNKWKNTTCTYAINRIFHTKVPVINHRKLNFSTL